MAAGVLALALGFAGAACGGQGGPAERTLAQASDRLAELRSGRIAMSGHADVVGSAPDVDVRAKGSFTAAGPDGAPVAELVYEGIRLVVRANAPLRAIRLKDWVAHPAVEPGPAIDGVATVHLHGRLVAHAALEDLRTLGLTVPLSADEVRSGSVDLWVGRGDHVLRRLVVTTDVGLQLPEGIAALLDRTIGATLRLELELTHPSVRGEGGPATVLP